MGWACGTCGGDRSGAYRVLVGKETVWENQNIILNCIVKNWDGEAWNGLLWLRIGTVSFSGRGLVYGVVKSTNGITQGFSVAKFSKLYLQLLLFTAPNVCIYATKTQSQPATKHRRRNSSPCSSQLTSLAIFV
jgi:hypothetical protein